jgi:hypothetical protein
MMALNARIEYDRFESVDQVNCDHFNSTGIALDTIKRSVLRATIRAINTLWSDREKLVATTALPVLFTPIN